jgi:site-specific recombinase XerD
MDSAEIYEKYFTYLREIRLMRPRSLQDYEVALKRLGEEIDPLAARCRGDVRDAILRIKKRLGWSDSTASKNSKCIKKFYDWAASEQLIPYNPYPMNEFKRPRPARPEFITQENFSLLINDPFLTHQERAMMWLLWETGIRVGEFVNLKPDDFDFKEKVLHVSEEISKGGYSDRYIPFGQECEDEMKAQLAWVKTHVLKPCVFVNQHWLAITARDVSTWLTKIGLRHSPVRETCRLTAHMFRHSFAVRRLEEGVPEVIVMRWLGHNSAEMMAHYTNMSKKSSRGFFERHSLRKQFAAAHVSSPTLLEAL